MGFYVKDLYVQRVPKFQWHDKLTNPPTIPETSPIIEIAALSPQIAQVRAGGGGGGVLPARRRHHLLHDPVVAHARSCTRPAASRRPTCTPCARASRDAEGRRAADRGPAGLGRGHRVRARPCSRADDVAAVRRSPRPDDPHRGRPCGGARRAGGTRRAGRRPVPVRRDRRRPAPGPALAAPPGPPGRALDARASTGTSRSRTEHWNGWTTPGAETSTQVHKVYVSPTVPCLPAALPVVFATAAALDVPSWKVGADAAGLHRADKIVLYLPSASRADAVAAALAGRARRVRRAGCAVHRAGRCDRHRVPGPGPGPGELARGPLPRGRAARSTSTARGWVRAPAGRGRRRGTGRARGRLRRRDLAP